jgi:hypothetical protein
MHPRLQGDPQQIFAFGHLNNYVIWLKNNAFAQDMFLLLRQVGRV